MNWILSRINKFHVRISNYGLLTIICFTLFVLPLISQIFTAKIFDFCLSLIIMISVYATSENKKISALLQVIVGLIAIWISRVIDFHAMHNSSKILLVMFFLTRVFKFIGQVSKRKEVTQLIIIEAINGYLLLGIAFGILIDFVSGWFPGAFNFVPGDINFFDPFYYSFITMSTLGYGDLLPSLPASKAIAIFVTLCGQIYLVTVMAFLIGRLISQGEKKDD
nr:potassium channel family protein [uncultured Carboxylicivirga sp.]